MSNYLKDYEIPFGWVLIRNKFIEETDELRLSANSYSPEVINSLKILELLSKKFELMKISDFSEKIFVGARSKRLFTTSDKGVPYLSPTDVFLFNLKPRKYVSKETKDIENWWVEPYTILITQSGSVGRSIIVNELFRDKVISPNMIRVFPNTEGKEIVGYIYAFINTWIGQALLTKTLYGITVKHIEPYHVANVNIPLLPESDIKEINNEILKAHRLREEAQKLLISAEEIFYKELNLPKIDKPYEEYLGEGEEKIVKAFTIRASMLDLRLDATYYMPSVKSLIDLIEKSTTGYLSNLGRITNRIFVPNRFKRIYVKDSQIGIPFLQGSHIPMVRLFDINYISRNMKNIEKIILKKDWILITRSGTVGRVALVTDYWNGWAGSEHLLRLVISNDVFPGYVLAFLLSSYGYYQIVAKVYGGVVDEIAEKDVSLIKEIKIIIPYDDSVQRKIHKLIRDAFSKKDEAIMIENAAIEKLERLLVEYSK